MHFILYKLHLKYEKQKYTIQKYDYVITIFFSCVLSLNKIEYVHSISKSLDEIIKKINRMVFNSPDEITSPF